tara:strand:+ start:10633 stop:11331 length:699 start_codon:yes stop_codon:yes gene_type:complete
MIQFLDEIEQHFEECYPREGCGLLSISKGKLQWHACTNVAENDEDFVMDSQEYLAISRRSDIIAVVHSHPDSSPEPSTSDINYCNVTGLIYHIFSYPEMELHTLHPVRETKSLYGRDYEFGKNDCFEAGKDYYAAQGIIIPNRPLFEDDWWEKGLDYFTEAYINTWNFKKVEGNLQKNDLLIFSINAVVGNHCGVYLGDDIFYHHADNRISCRENLYPFWKKYITGAYRYEA